MHVLVTRPESDAAALRKQLEALGHTVTVEPLLRIYPLPVAANAVDEVAGLIATSRNALRTLAKSPAIDKARKLPLIAVGPGTTQIAHELGFARVIAGTGSAADLVPTIMQTAGELKGPLAHVRGEEGGVRSAWGAAGAWYRAARNCLLSRRRRHRLPASDARPSGAGSHRRRHLDVAANRVDLRPPDRR
ncbi:MAG: uroporphyrinogen-III synthase [Hyphomicrobium sp.]|nr:uroporphyrinogen-III synthase [Hyphomicrobium sp.]